MLSRVHSFLLMGIDAEPCEIEVDWDERGLVTETIVGLPDAAVRESMQRVRSAVGNAGYPMPNGRVVINLAPADVRKEGPLYDLPVAVGLLVAQGVLSAERAGLDDTLIAGELALGGKVRAIRGAVALASLAAATGKRRVILPAENAHEASLVPGIEVFGVRDLVQVVGLLSGELDDEPHAPPDMDRMLRTAEAAIDFAEVRGQEAVKRAMVIAAAGAHNIVMLGPAGSGKTMMAKALPGILPPLTVREAVELTRIYSAAGELDDNAGLVTIRPVRTPHHTASGPAIVGGGVIPRPGEISLAHHGVLFLDELPEFGRGVLETLRQPLEDHVVTIARAAGSVRFPADFMLVAAMNPTPKGDVSPGEVGRREMERYLARLSGPLLDRIDLHVEAPAVPWDRLSGSERGTGTAEMRDMVLKAQAARVARGHPETPNARLRGGQLDEFAAMSSGAMELLGQAMRELGLSARAYDKIRRVSRTIADLDGREGVDDGDVAEAVQYRLLDRR